MTERKLRHLVDAARTLLIYMHVPKSFWVDVIFCACHLINRMHSSALHDKILFFYLYDDRSTFSVVPCVFTYICFVQNL